MNFLFIKKCKPETQKAFTLIEMLVVLLIIALLMTLAIPDQTPRIAKTQINDAVKYCDDIKPKIKLYYEMNNAFPKDNLLAALPEPEKLVSTLIKKINIEDGVIHITFGNSAVAPLQDQILSLQPLTVIGSSVSPIDWTCGFSKIPDSMEAKGENKTSIKTQYLPVKCMKLQ